MEHCSPFLLAHSYLSFKAQFKVLTPVLVPWIRYPSVFLYYLMYTCASLLPLSLHQPVPSTWLWASPHCLGTRAQHTEDPQWTLASEFIHSIFRWVNWDVQDHRATSPELFSHLNKANYLLRELLHISINRAVQL